MNSKEKGKRGERELAKILQAYGYDSHRGQQYSGMNGDADVIGIPGIHIECKRVERLHLDEAMSQSKRDAQAKADVPVVMHRKNRGEWMCTMLLDDWLKLYKAAEESYE